MRKTTALVALIIVCLGIGVGFVIGRLSGGDSGNNDPLTIVANAVVTVTATPSIATPTQSPATPAQPLATPTMLPATPNPSPTQEATPISEDIFIAGTPTARETATAVATATPSSSPTATTTTSAGTDADTSDSSLSILNYPWLFVDLGTVDAPVPPEASKSPENLGTSSGSDGTGGALLTPVPTPTRFNDPSPI